MPASILILSMYFSMKAVLRLTLVVILRRRKLQFFLCLCYLQFVVIIRISSWGDLPSDRSCSPFPRLTNDGHVANAKLCLTVSGIAPVFKILALICTFLDRTEAPSLLSFEMPLITVIFALVGRRTCCEPCLFSPTLCIARHCFHLVDEWDPKTALFSVPIAELVSCLQI